MRQLSSIISSVLTLLVSSSSGQRCRTFGEVCSSVADCPSVGSVISEINSARAANNRDVKHALLDFVRGKRQKVPNAVSQTYYSK